MRHVFTKPVRIALPWPRTTAFLLGLFVAVGLLGSHRHLDTIDPGVNIGWQAGQAAFTLDKPNTSNKANASIDYAYEDWSQYSNGFDPLAYNPRPITEVQLVSCTFPPSLFQVCEPASSEAEDAVRGKWVRLDRDLNRRIGLWYLYIFYRRALPTSNTPVLTNLTVISTADAQASSLRSSLIQDGWDVDSKNVHSGLFGAQKAHLYSLTVGRDDPQAENAYTELDIVFGESAVRWGWEYVTTVSDLKGPEKDKVQIHGRRKNKKLPSTPKLRFDQAGDFVTLQLADLHFSVDVKGGECRDIANSTACPRARADISTLVWLNKVIDDVKPDFVVLSGDQLNGQDTSWTASSVIYKVALLFKDRKIPWTIIFGNHDSQSTDLNREGQMAVYRSLPYFMGSAGPEDVDGVGNYVLPILSADDSDTTTFNMYFLDSHANLDGWFSRGDEYKPLSDKQIRWFRSQSDAVDPILRPYKPADLTHEKGAFGLDNNLDSAQRFKKIRRQSGNQQSLRRPNAMAWFHIPLPEAYDEPDSSEENGDRLEVGTTDLEGYSASKSDNGFFVKAILSQREEDQQQSAPEVKVLAHGHSHLRDACSRVQSVWHCFSGGSSYAGYGMRGFDRRVRVYKISDHGESIASYKLIDGSGQGDRESGEFEMLKSEGIQSPTHSDGSGNSTDGLGEDAIEQQWDALVDELKEEEEALESNVQEAADGISELVDEMSGNSGPKDNRLTREALKRNIPPSLSGRQSSTERPSSSGGSSGVQSRFKVLDYTVLVGRGALR